MHCKVPPVVPYKALGNFSKALYGTTGSTCSARFFRPVMEHSKGLSNQADVELDMINAISAADIAFIMSSLQAILN